jgi:hypothetical protein
MRAAHERGDYRITTDVQVFRDGTAELHYQYELYVRGMWYGLCRVHWSQVLDEQADAIREVKETLRQYALQKAASDN